MARRAAPPAGNQNNVADTGTNRIYCDQGVASLFFTGIDQLDNHQFAAIEPLLFAGRPDVACYLTNQH